MISKLMAIRKKYIDGYMLTGLRVIPLENANE